jgi:two-component system cell cycle sensor histidine kinase/response regulator CckA
MIPPNVFHQIQSVIGTGRPWRSREPCGAGCDGDMMVSASPILEPGGAVSGGVVEISDFTHERRTEEFVRQSQKLESLGTLVGGVAHDFNNTLQVISGYLDLGLKQAQGNPQLMQDLGEAARAAQSASAVTRQLLAFSRQGKLERHWADLNDLVSSHAQMVRRLLRRDIKLVVARAPGPLPVDADAGSLEQVLLNLYLNAQDAMPAGGTLSVELERVTSDEEFRLGRAWAQHPEYAVVRVRDTGMGMTQEVIARIFDPFFTTKPTGKGTGLGLTVAYGILRQHDGMIGASSHPGDGTTITLYLPIGRSAAVEGPRPDAAPQVRGTETILLIESDDAVRGLAAAALKSHGFRVLTAGDAEAALRAVAAPDGRADLVVMDVHAPGVAGQRFYEQLIARRPGLPVVATSGQMSAEDSGELARRGVPLLKKPYSTAALVGVLREMLDLARSAPPPRPLS